MGVPGRVHAVHRLREAPVPAPEREVSPMKRGQLELHGSVPRRTVVVAADLAQKLIRLAQREGYKGITLQPWVNILLQRALAERQPSTEET